MVNMQNGGLDTDLAVGSTSKALGTPPCLTTAASTQRLSVRALTQGMGRSLRSYSADAKAQPPPALLLLSDFIGPNLPELIGGSADLTPPASPISTDSPVSRRLRAPPALRC